MTFFVSDNLLSFQTKEEEKNACFGLWSVSSSCVAFQNYIPLSVYWIHTRIYITVVYIRAMNFGYIRAMNLYFPFYFYSRPEICI